MRKTYMSLAVSRAMAVDYPIGDPTGGAAYGAREMPVVAVAIAVWEVVAVAEVGFAALTAFEAISVVSAVVGAVGAVTGNQDLVKIGTIGGIIGGVGSFAANQGWIGSESMGVNAEGVATTYKAGEQTAFQKALGINAPPETGKVEPVVTAPAVTEAPAAAPAAAPAVTEAPAAAAPAVTEAPAAASVPAAAAPTGAPVTNVAGSATGVVDNSLFGSFKAFAKANPTIAYAGMTTAGAAVAGLFDPTKEAQKLELEARAKAENQAAATSATAAAAQAQQTANLAAPLTVATTAGARAPVYGTNPVTGKPLTNADYTRSGLINTVTGRV